MNYLVFIIVLASACAPHKKESALSTDDNQKIHVSIASADVKAGLTNPHVVLFSMPADAMKMSVCAVKDDKCEAQKMYDADLRASMGQLKVFQPKSPLEVELGKMYRVAAFDNASKQLYYRQFSFEKPIVQQPAPDASPSPGASPSPSSTPGVQLGAKDMEPANNHGAKKLSEIMGTAKYLLIKMSQKDCEPCATLNDLVEASSVFKSETCKYITIAQDLNAWLEFVSNKGSESAYQLSFAHVASTFQMPQVTGVPSSFLIDEKGNVVTGQTYIEGAPADYLSKFSNWCK